VRPRTAHDLIELIERRRLGHGTFPRRSSATCGLATAADVRFSESWDAARKPDFWNSITLCRTQTEAKPPQGISSCDAAQPIRSGVMVRLERASARTGSARIVWRVSPARSGPSRVESDCDGAARRPQPRVIRHHGHSVEVRARLSISWMTSDFASA
jgi:hypothetical protein